MAVTWEHEDLFFNHFEADLLIVSKGATIDTTDNQEPVVTDSTVVIRTTDFISEDFEFKDTLCGSGILTFGNCNSAYVKLGIYNSDSIPNIEDEVVEVWYYFNNLSSTMQKLGTYVVESDKRSDDRQTREITMYDRMHLLVDINVSKWFNTNLPDANSTMTFGQMRDSLIEYLIEEGTLPEGQIEIELPNDDTVYTRGDFNSDTLSALFVFEKLCEANGCYGHITPDDEFGYIILPRYDSTPTSEITADEYFPPVRYEDYTTKGYRYIAVYDGNNTQIREYGNGDSDKYSTYNIVDNFLFNTMDSEDVYDALVKVYPNIRYRTYTPFEAKCIGDLCREVGDRIRVKIKGAKTIKTYILERKLKGIAAMQDTFTAEGQFRVTSLQYGSSGETSNNSLGNESSEGSSNSNSYNSTTGYSSEWFTNLPEIIRNFGMRLLDEPTNVVLELTDEGVSITWDDPSDLNNNRPCPVEYAGTVVVRKKGKPPRNRWDGTLITNSTIRNAHQTEPVIDPVDVNKKYFYGIFPYDTEGHYRYTKSVGINTDYKGEYPEITSIIQDNSNVVVNFTLPSGTWTSRKLVYKQGSIPEDATDGTAIDLSSTDTQKSIDDIEEYETYYFIIFMQNSSYEVDSNCVEFTMGEIPPAPEPEAMFLWDYPEYGKGEVNTGNEPYSTLADIVRYQDGTTTDIKCAYVERRTSAAGSSNFNVDASNTCKIERNGKLTIKLKASTYSKLDFELVPYIQREYESETEWTDWQWLQRMTFHLASNTSTSTMTLFQMQQDYPLITGAPVWKPPTIATQDNWHELEIQLTITEYKISGFKMFVDNEEWVTTPVYDWAYSQWSLIKTSYMLTADKVRFVTVHLGQNSWGGGAIKVQKISTVFESPEPSAE